jgi:hypothetical protein
MVTIAATEYVLGKMSGQNAQQMRFTTYADFEFMTFAAQPSRPIPAGRFIWGMPINEWLVLRHIGNNINMRFQADTGAGIDHHFVLSPEALAQLKATPEYQASESKARAAVAQEAELTPTDANYFIQ